MNEGILFNSDSENTAQAVMAALARRGLYVVRSFDLRSALDQFGGCECPHHGTAQCNCQFVVLLVYGDPSTGSGRDVGEPVVLTSHSRDGQTDARIVHDAVTVPDPRLAEQVMAALVEAAITLQAASAPAQDMTAHVG